MRPDVETSPKAGVLRLWTDWDAEAWETRAITPAESQAAVLTWEGFPDIDGGIPEWLTSPLASALTSLGEVCFRHRSDPGVGVRTLGEVRSAPWPLGSAWHVIGSRKAEGVVDLFDADWAQGDQIALVASSDDARVLQMLGVRRPCDVRLEGAELLVGAIVDGGGVLLAAASAERLQAGLAAVAKAVGQAGISSDWK